jgi:hypothetical protein
VLEREARGRDGEPLRSWSIDDVDDLMMEKARQRRHFKARKAREDDVRMECLKSGL